MQDSERLEKLETLLRATKAAHLEAFQHTNGADPDWPDWYAARLKGPCSNLFSVELTRDALNHLLVAADETQRMEAPDGDWVPFYARFLAHQLQSPIKNTPSAKPGD
jgi:hypothetical protein